MHLQRHFTLEITCAWHADICHIRDLFAFTEFLHILGLLSGSCFNFESEYLVLHTRFLYICLPVWHAPFLSPFQLPLYWCIYLPLVFSVVAVRVLSSCTLCSSVSSIIVLTLLIPSCNEAKQPWAALKPSWIDNRLLCDCYVPSNCHVYMCLSPCLITWPKLHSWSVSINLQISTI